jgi:hypothetical protein
MICLDCCTSPTLFVVSMKTGRVFKGSKASADKDIVHEAEAANPVVEDLDD